MTAQLCKVRAASALVAAGALLLVAGNPLAHGASGPETSPPDDRSGGSFAAAEETIRYEVLSAASEVRIYVMRGGPLARLGHNHIVGGKVVAGEIWLAPGLSDSGFLLSVRAGDLEVDRPAWRREAGAAFSKQPSARDIAGTRDNLLGPRVLDAEQYPAIRLESVEIRGSLPKLSALTRLTVRAQTHAMPVEVRVSKENSQLVAEGEFTLLQSAVGIKPFSVLLGSIRVQDELRVVFRIVARARP